MKKIWRKSWKDEAVSPVIATILMVAITVVLAAVLYLVVTQIMIPPRPPPPKLFLGNGEAIGDGQWKIEINTADRFEDLQGFEVVLLNGSAIAIGSTPLTTIKDPGYSGGGLSLKFFEPNANGKLDPGDYFILSGTDDSSDYILDIYYQDAKASGEGGKIVQ